MVLVSWAAKVTGNGDSERGGLWVGWLVGSLANNDNNTMVVGADQDPRGR